MDKNQIKQMIKEEIITEGLLGNVLKVLVGGLVTKGIAKSIVNRDVKDAVKDVELKKAAENYASAHADYVEKLEALEKKMGVKFPADMKKPPADLK